MKYTLWRASAVIGLAMVMVLAVPAGPGTSASRGGDGGPNQARTTVNPAGWAGAYAGSRIAAPNSGTSWASGSTYGSIARATNPVSATKTMNAIERFARKWGVPWPKTGTTRATDMSTHRVYQIYGPGERGGSRLYKYGITKVGKSRPQSQLAACRKKFGADCTFSWVRNDVDGWLRARKVEAGYAARYKARFGHCPPGMRRCL